jgi:hypothetical protein
MLKSRTYNRETRTYSDLVAERLIEDAYNSGEQCTVSFRADCLFLPLLGPQNLNLIFSAVDSTPLPPAQLAQPATASCVMVFPFVTAVKWTRLWDRRHMQQRPALQGPWLAERMQSGEEQMCSRRCSGSGKGRSNFNEKRSLFLHHAVSIKFFVQLYYTRSCRY